MRTKDRSGIELRRKQTYRAKSNERRDKAVNELEAVFRSCDNMFKSADIDYNELKNRKIGHDFFENYTNIRIVNSFLFNFSKLQDKIGEKLFRKLLYELKEIDSLNLPMIDVLNIL